jgi:hypothetical protein
LLRKRLRRIRSGGRIEIFVIGGLLDYPAQDPNLASVAYGHGNGELGEHYACALDESVAAFMQRVRATSEWRFLVWGGLPDTLQ